jgi:hypothetical protein
MGGHMNVAVEGRRLSWKKVNRLIGRTGETILSAAYRPDAYEAVILTGDTYFRCRIDRWTAEVTTRETIGTRQEYSAEMLRELTCLLSEL